MNKNANKISLKDARKLTGLSQEEFAKKLDMKYGTYVKKELYLRGLSAEEIIKISDFTKVPIRNILLK